MRVGVFNKRYAIPSLLQAFSLALAWIRPSLNTFLLVLHHDNTLKTALIIYCIVIKSSFWSLPLIITHRFSIVFMSVEFSGHSSTVNLLSSKNVRIFCEVWHGARS